MWTMRRRVWGGVTIAEGAAIAGSRSRDGLCSPHASRADRSRNICRRHLRLCPRCAAALCTASRVGGPLAADRTSQQRLAAEIPEASAARGWFRCCAFPAPAPALDLPAWRAPRRRPHHSRHPRSRRPPFAISVMHSAWSEDVCSHQPMRGLVLCRSEGYFVAPHIACQARMQPSA